MAYCMQQCYIKEPLSSIVTRRTERARLRLYMSEQTFDLGDRKIEKRQARALRVGTLTKLGHQESLMT